MLSSWKQEAWERGRAVCEVGFFLPEQHKVWLVLGMEEGHPALGSSRAQRYLQSSGRLATYPSSTSQALSCISCKH